MVIFYKDGHKEEVYSIEVDCLNPDLIIINKMESRRKEDILIVQNANRLSSAIDMVCLHCVVGTNCEDCPVRATSDYFYADKED